MFDIAVLGRPLVAEYKAAYSTVQERPSSAILSTDPALSHFSFPFEQEPFKYNPPVSTSVKIAYSVLVRGCECLRVCTCRSGRHELFESLSGVPRG